LLTDDGASPVPDDGASTVPAAADSKPSDTYEGAADRAEKGVAGILNVVKFIKKPSVKSAGEALSGIGAFVLLLPPPAGLVGGSVLMLAGGLMSIFSPSTPSAEMQMMMQIDKKLDAIMKNQEAMFEDLNDIKYKQSLYTEYRMSDIKKI